MHDLEFISWSFGPSPSGSMPGSPVNDVPWPRGRWVPLHIPLPALPTPNKHRPEHQAAQSSSTPVLGGWQETTKDRLQTAWQTWLRGLRFCTVRAVSKHTTYWRCKGILCPHCSFRSLNPGTVLDPVWQNRTSLLWGMREFLPMTSHSHFNLWLWMLFLTCCQPSLGVCFRRGDKGGALTSETRKMVFLIGKGVGLFITYSNFKFY